LVTVILFLFSPIVILSGVVAGGYAWHTKALERKKRLFEVLFGFLVLGTCGWFLYFDPFRVLYWFMD